MTASALDPENRLSEVQFYAGNTLLTRVMAAPYTYKWVSVPAGVYTLTAVAVDADGGSTTSGPVPITVASPMTTPWRVMFAASPDHTTKVTSYLLEIFAGTADPNTAIPILTSDLGKPTVNTSGEIVVDRTSVFSLLPPGTYVMTVRAIGTSGWTRSGGFTFAR
jgi:hypothetical protein